MSKSDGQGQVLQYVGMEDLMPKDHLLRQIRGELDLKMVFEAPGLLLPLEPGPSVGGLDGGLSDVAAGLSVQSAGEAAVRRDRGARRVPLVLRSGLQLAAPGPDDAGQVAAAHLGEKRSSARCKIETASLLAPPQGPLRPRPPAMSATSSGRRNWPEPEPGSSAASPGPRSTADGARPGASGWR